MPSESKLLLIEDDELLRELLHEFLADDGFTVVEAQDGKTAQSLLQSDTYDVILCDLFMPNMDGISLIRWLRGQGQSIPVIILSGTISTDINQALKDLNVTDRFFKPLTSEELGRLSERLQQLLHG